MTDTRKPAQLTVPAIAILALAVTRAAISATGDPDVTYGDAGRVELPAMISLAAVEPLPDGSALVFGTRGSLGNGTDPAAALLVRVDPGGNVASTTVLGAGELGGATRLRDGRLVVTVRTLGSGEVHWFFADGRRDTTLGAEGRRITADQILTGYPARAVGLSQPIELPDGELALVATTADESINTAFDPAVQAAIVFLGPNGEIRSRRAPEPLLSQRGARDPQALPDGTVLFASRPGCCEQKPTHLMTAARDGAITVRSTLAPSALAYAPSVDRWYGVVLEPPSTIRWFDGRVDSSASYRFVQGRADGTLLTPDGTLGSAPRVASLGSASLYMGTVAIDSAGGAWAAGTLTSEYDDLPATEGSFVQLARLSPAGQLSLPARLPVWDQDRWSSATVADAKMTREGRLLVLVADGGSLDREGVAPVLMRFDGPPAPGQAGTAGFAVPTLRIAEGGGRRTASVVRVGGATGAASVRLQVVDGTASAGDRLVSAQVLTWADGDASPKTVTVEAPDDALLEGEETFSIRLVDPRGVQTTQRALTVTIEDDEALRSLVVAAAEPRITAGGNVAFVVRPSRAVLGPISVVGYVSDGFDANGWPNASGINSSGAIRTLLRWPAGSTAEQRMSMGTNRTYVKPEYSMHARLSWVAGLVRNDAGPIGASLVVAPPPPATPPTSSGGPSPAPAGSASSGGGSGGGGTFGFAGVIGLAGLALLRHRRR